MKATFLVARLAPREVLSTPFYAGELNGKTLWGGPLEAVQFIKLSEAQKIARRSKDFEIFRKLSG